MGLIKSTLCLEIPKTESYGARASGPFFGISPTVVLINNKFPERSAVDDSPRECVRMTLPIFIFFLSEKNHQAIPQMPNNPETTLIHRRPYR